jgi:hypothetical protein
VIEATGSSREAASVLTARSDAWRAAVEVVRVL